MFFMFFSDSEISRYGATEFGLWYCYTPGSVNQNKDGTRFFKLLEVPNSNKRGIVI